ncbi:MAG: hypothetical protein KDM91_18365 [Verrucomicrobiae bacterium]|nr:hypothetical protein [Verrucomicrobiae bacterium]
MSHPSADIAESPGRTEFVRAAETVRNRLGWLGFLRWLAAGHWAIALIGLGIVLWLRLGSGWRAGELRIVLGLLGAWIVVGIVVALARRPDRLRALLVWDEHGGWKERFSSAFAFADRSDRAAYEGERLHIATALRDLPDALARVKADLPAPSLRWVWVLPLLAVIFAASPLLRLPLDPSDALLDPEMVAEARNQAENLARDAEEVKKVDGLDDAEKKEFEKLSAAVDGAAEDLADAEGQTAREVLEALEARARAAEALADKLGLATDAWASEEMLREMSQHADTADLASALKDKNADRAADESDLLADTLDDPEIKLETQDRLSAALDRTTEKATDEDKTKPVGERFGNAARKLDDKQSQTAAREFEELAKHFRQVKQREEAQEKLRDLAEKLRESGSSISGSKLEKMQQLAGKGNAGKQPPGGLQPLQQNPLQNMPGITPMSQQPGQNAGQQAGNSGQSQQMPIRGAQNPQGQGQQQGQPGGLAMPVPGTGQKGQQQGLAMGQPGQGSGQKSGSGLLAPIPGQNPGGGSPAAGLGAPGAAGGQSAAGGDQAGQGTAAIGKQESEIAKAARDAKVVAQVNQDGESTMRAVEGKFREEKAQRTQQEVIVDFIKVQEEALDEQALPLSRRAQVQRYFNALRERFEKDQ